MKDKFALRLTRSRGNLLAATAVLLIAAVFFVTQWPLALEGENPPMICWWYVLSFLGLSVLGALLCLVRIDLSPRAGRRTGWLLVVLFPLGAFVAVDVINATRIWQFPGRRWLANYLCYLLVFALSFLLTRRSWAAVALGGAVSMTFGIANYFVVQFRGQPILPWDFQSFSTALTVSGGYEYVPTKKMAVAVLGYICAVLLCYKLTPHHMKTTRRLRVMERLTAAGASAVLVMMLFPLNSLSGLGVSVWAWNQKTGSEITGIAASFFANVQFMMVEEPQGYSPSRVEELCRRIEELQAPEPIGEPGGKPTIIAIMNESMTDFGSLGTLDIEPDNQPYLHALQQSNETVWGTAYSSVYGGNTCNSEYEFLTGNTMAFLPSGSKPYQQYIDSPQTALPGILKSYGYHCTAIHPGNRTAWERIDAYPHLGFDEFVDAEIFDIRRSFEHRLTSDMSCYEQVIYEYERWNELKHSPAGKDDPLFIFNVTIQNHGGYEDPNYDTTVHIGDFPGKWPQAEQYLSLTKSSDSALEYLLDYFEHRQDPVVVLFFGDHWPKLEDGFNRAVLSSYDSNKDMYRVPFFIWANYPLKAEKIEAVSLNYLSGLLLRAAGLDGTAYTNYLEHLREQLPVITEKGKMDRHGNYFMAGAPLPKDREQLLSEYKFLQYNNSFDGEHKVMRIFSRQD